MPNVTGYPWKWLRLIFLSWCYKTLKQEHPLSHGLRSYLAKGRHCFSLVFMCFGVQCIVCVLSTSVQTSPQGFHWKDPWVPPRACYWPIREPKHFPFGGQRCPLGICRLTEQHAHSRVSHFFSWLGSRVDSWPRAQRLQLLTKIVRSFLRWSWLGP